MNPKNNEGYVNLTSEVKGGHRRSKLLILKILHLRSFEVSLCLDHALTAKHRDMIFGMDTHVAPGSKIGYVILTFEVN